MAEGGVLRQLLTEFFFKVSTKELEDGKKKTADILGDIKKVAAAFAGGVIAAGIKNFTKETIDEITAIRRGAAELRISTDEFQAMRSAGRALGIDIKWLHFSMERLLVSTELAARGSTRQATAMKLAGLETKKANGEHKSAAELFLDLAGGLEKIKEPAKQAIVVWDLFGRGGHRLLPMLLVGKERLQALMETTKKYGQYSKETIALAAQFSVSAETLRAAQTGLKDTIMKSVLPALERGVIKTREWIVWFNELAKRSLIGRAALYALSAVMTGIAIKMALAHPMVLALVAGFTALVLVLDDLMVWWNGGKSIFGDVIDGLFGKGQSTALIEKLRDLYRDLAATIEGIGVALGVIKNKSTTETLSEAPGGGAAAPTIGASTVTNSGRGMFGGDTETVGVPGGVEVRRGWWDRHFGGDVEFGAPPILDTQSRPDDSPRMSVNVASLNVNMTAPEGADAMSFGTAAGRAANEELQRQIKASAAALTRRKRR